MAKRAAAKIAEPAEIKIDLGSGKNGREGFVKVDVRNFDGVDIVCDLGKQKWPWKDNSVTEANASHFVEHLTGPERIHFANELYRVLIPGGKAQVIVPHWNSPRAYGDLTHQWPPVSEWWFLYLNRDWRASQAPHNDGYTCHFEITYGYSLRPDIAVGRSQEYQQYALANYKDAAQDIISTWTARK